MNKGLLCDNSYPEFDDNTIVVEVAACLFHGLVLFDIGEDSLLKGRTGV